jgi:hypothetical protein
MGSMPATDSASFSGFLYGTAWKEERTQALTELALHAGFRGIDTANQRRHYFERGVGDALAAYGAGVVTRADIFLQTKFTDRAGQDDRLPYESGADLSTQVAQSPASSLQHTGGNAMTLISRPTRALMVIALVGAIVTNARAAAPSYPDQKEGDFTVRDFRFQGGETLPEVRLHYTTMGTPQRDQAGHVTNAVLLLHGTSVTGKTYPGPTLAGELFGPGQRLDASRYYIILPDGLWRSGVDHAPAPSRPAGCQPEDRSSSPGEFARCGRARCVRAAGGGQMRHRELMAALAPAKASQTLVVVDF